MDKDLYIKHLEQKVKSLESQRDEAWLLTERLSEIVGRYNDLKESLAEYTIDIILNKNKKDGNDRRKSKNPPKEG